MAKAPAQQANQEEEGAEVHIEENAGSLQVNLGGVDAAKKFENIPAGIYLAEIDELEFGKSQSKDNPMWTVMLRIAEGDYEGRKIPTWCTFTEGGLPRVKRFLLCLTDDTGNAAQYAEGSFDPEQVAQEGTLIGARLRIQIKLRRDQNKELRSNVTEYMPVDAEDLNFETA